ncbi:hypothetical protein NMQ14_01480 [Methyloversatilis sp. XJ19-13]|uniref:hypothetical protein n=1 Tax=Methyloversatilis sp. XJ19-13 TaxID=2963430 RepID=UPI00211C4DCB|nr:hypothetical protein [Methyloversatilis sp. XJ19-13]MCQ9372916.1 hypothetical protein [Methyloversatilis sp. XJ19-13]
MHRASHFLFYFAFMLCASSAWAGKYKAPAVIIATLPQYCLAQYIDGLENDSRFQIIGCGAYSNHYCPGLVEIAQARKTHVISKKSELLNSARKNMEYTLRGTRDQPNCFLRQEAESNLNLINTMLKSIPSKAR